MTTPTQAVAEAVNETIHELALTNAERGQDAAVEAAVCVISGATVFLRTTLGPERACGILQDATALCGKPAPMAVRPTHPAPQTRN